ncbi:MAG TPA: EAL domain-containing protein [Mycobacteriales bacterium]|nr:EAL domain-containing protein [Mycobacteriales bacterium]
MPGDTPRPGAVGGVREQALLEMLHTVALAANAAATATEVEQVALDLICATTSWASGRVLVPRSDGRWAPNGVECGAEPLAGRLRREVAGGPDALPRAVRLAAGEVPGWELVERAPGESALLVVGVPVVVRGEHSAVVELLADSPEPPGARLLAALSAVAVQIGHVLEREQARAELLESAGRLRQVVDLAADAFVEVDDAGRVTDWNPAAERVFGWRAIEVLGRSVAEVLVPARLRAAHQRGLERFVHTGQSRLGGEVVTVPALHRDGHELLVELSLSVRQEADGRVVQAFLRDVTARERAAQEMQAQRDFLDTVLDSLTEGVVACDSSGRLTLVNRSHREVWGLPNDPRPPRDWILDLEMYRDDGVTPLPIEQSPMYRALQGEHVDDEDVVVGRPGNYRRLRCTARPLQHADGTRLGALCAMQDVTDQLAFAEELENVRHSDPVTGLPNASALTAALAGLPPRVSHSLVQLSVEDLSTTVATSGVTAGEQLLRQVADRLRAAVRDSDLVAHLGAERFAVLLRHDPRTDASRLADRLLRSLTRAGAADAGPARRLVLSAGLAAVDRDDPELALSQSEVALHTARTSGGGRLEEFDPEMAERLHRHLVLRDELEAAIAGGQLALRYQPQFDLATGQVRGVEALVRWHHPERGMVRPDEFIPLAEDTGLIVPLGRWVLQEACRQAASWRSAGLPPVCLAVNVSGSQLDEQFLDDVDAVLRDTGLPPDQLELEVTESVAVAEDRLATGVLRRLREMGVTLSIDDFGTGYSMLSRLRSLPFSQLKIDRSFVAEVQGGNRAPLLSAMLTMAHGLGLHVVAEGVETVEQLTFLRQRSCAVAQGFLLARPLEADAVPPLIAEPPPLPEPGAEQRSAAFAPAAVESLDLRSLFAEVERLTGLESVYLTRVQAGQQEVVAARNTGDLVIPEGTRVPWASSVCASALQDGAVALDDVAERFADNPHVRALGMASYLGVPIEASDGTPLGTLCAASSARVPVSQEQLAVVQVYARLAGERMLRADLLDAHRERLAQSRVELARRAAFLAEAEVNVRQPLTSLGGWVSVLERGADDAQARAEVVRSSALVTRQLDRLLDEARAAVLRQSLTIEPVSLSSEVNAVLDAWRDSGTLPVVETEQDLLVRADRVALSKVLRDVLHNAVVYDPTSSPVRVSWQRVETAVELSVVDAGVGLDPDIDPFAPFTRSSDPHVRSVTGAGLSLYACRALAESMGGTLLGRRNPDRGSTFVLWLPAA